jgi:SAM-dependent methyltransferase
MARDASSPIVPRARISEPRPTAAGRQCPNCRSEDATVRYDFGEQQILCCRACGLLYLYPWPSPEETEAVYGDKYFENEQFMQGTHAGLYGYADYVAERFNKQIQFAEIARAIRAKLPEMGGRTPRLLEVGCGFGYFLDVAFEERFDVMGLEFNPYAVERLRRKYAFPILAGALETAELESGSLDAAVMFDVIEHLRDPFTSLDHLHEALAPGGVLVLTTVDAESFASRLIGKRLEDFRRTREHLLFFGRTTMRTVLAQHGFEVTEIRSIGHTFDLAFLIERLMLYNRPLFGALRRAIVAIGLGQRQIYLNPGTKMIVYARRRPER